jgi:hypothetical protein
MRNNLLYSEEIVEKFYAYIDRAIIIKIGYLLLIFFLRWLNVYSAPEIVFIALSLMALNSLVIGIWFERFSVELKTILSFLFLATILDIFLLTIIIYYLGEIEFMYYTFFILLSFIVFARFQAITIAILTIFLFLGSVVLRYFQVIPVHPPGFLPEEQTFYNFPYILTNTLTFIITLSFLGYFSHGFYRMMAKRITLLRQTQRTLEEERASLEIRVEARKKDLEIEKESLGRRVRERKKELAKERETLEERIKELERFQRVAGGREMKIKELEKEIAKLRKSK